MLTNLIAQLVEFLHAYSHIAYGVVFLLAMSESLPVIGAIVPGTAVIIALSALVPSGVLVVWPLLAAATLGAISGDGLAFWLGHRYHASILSLWPFSRYPAAIRRSEDLFARYGARSVFLARFLPGIRAFVPLLAGTLGMHVARFYAVNIFSAMVWAPAHVLPGVLFGVTLHALGPAAKPLGALLFTLAILSWLFVQGARYAIGKGLPLLQTAGEAIQSRLAGRTDRASRLLHQLLDPAGNELRVIALLVVVMIAGAWLFFGILEDVFSGDPLVRADLAVYQLLQGFRSYPSDAVMVAITELGDTVVVIAVAAALLAYLLWARARHTVIFFLGAIAGASAVNTAIKVALHRARPTDGLYTGWSAFSFPSGHSTVNMALYGALAFLIVLHAKGRLTLTTPIVAGLLVLAIAFSRLYLGAHWFSDVAGGMAFGLAWIALLAVSFIRKPEEKLNPAFLASIPIVVLGTFGVWHVINSHAADMTRYAVRSEIPQVEFSVWWHSGETIEGARRIDLTGDAEERFSLEWAGDITPLKEALLGEGWQASAQWSPQSLAVLASGASPDTKIPAFPLLSSGRLPALVLVHPAQREDRRFVMRFWTENLQVKGRITVPVWKATITLEDIRRPLGLVAYPAEGGDGSTQSLPGIAGILARNGYVYSASAGMLRSYDSALP